jgi:hypothetical protein
VTEYCKLNDIENIDEFMYKCFQEGFNIKKYGLLGGEVRGEVTVEVPVEVIKEVEKIVEIIKEVPVEVIKEVEKIIYTSDDTQVNEMSLKIEELNGEISIKTTEIDRIREEFSIKTKEMENIFQNEMSKKDLKLDDNKVKMLQQTVQNLTNEIRILKKKNEDLNKQLLEKPIESDFTRARFHGSSNLNNDLYR